MLTMPPYETVAMLHLQQISRVISDTLEVPFSGQTREAL
jgi:hypothetical protein